MPDVPSNPKPSSADILDLVQRWQTQGDRRARDKLLRLFQPQIARAAAMASLRYGLDRDDCQQEAAMGFLHAIDKFDPEGGASLATYGKWWIRQHLARWRLHDHVVHRPVDHEYRRTKIHRVRVAMEAEGETVTPEAIAERLGISPSAVNIAVQTAGRDVSLNDPLKADDGDSTTYLDQLAGDGPSPEDVLIDADTTRAQREAIERAIDKLSPAQARIMRPLSRGLSMTDAAAELGMSRQNVSLMAARAMAKMKKSLAGGLGL